MVSLMILKRAIPYQQACLVSIAQRSSHFQKIWQLAQKAADKNGSPGT